MVKFLISRPIAVIMVFVAVLMLGIVSYRALPMALLPDIDIPQITVQLSYPQSSAREIESSIVRNLRSQLMQVAHISDIQSETQDGHAVIKLSFDYGTPIDYAFIEVNEKLDASMKYLPRDMDRPRVIKASATDLPVFYLNVSLKGDSITDEKLNSDKFLELSEFSESVIRKRIEQLTEVAMVDISGLMSSEVLITPDKDKMESLNINAQHIEQAIQVNNVDIGNIMVRDGYYQYQIRFTSKLRTAGDIKNIYLPVHDKVLQIKDIADVAVQTRKSRGMFLTGNKQAVTMAIIQQAGVKMLDMKQSLTGLIDHLRNDYPQLEFEITRDQSLLLDISMSNLQMDLFMGALMAFVILFFFLGDFRAPVLIGITIPMSLIISLLFFRVFGISINIISLAGLTLGLGMIIDCSIIVIENILHHYHRGKSLAEACDAGTSEVIRPMLSSTLATSSVFLPLIFLSGIAGALFFDEAVSVSIGNAASFIVAITILPVLFKQLYREKSNSGVNEKNGRKWYKFQILVKLIKWLRTFLSKYRLDAPMERWYESGVDWVFRHKSITTSVFFALIFLNLFLFFVVKKERLPALPQTESMISIDWNENIHLDENKTRILKLLDRVKQNVLVSNSMIGEQQFLMNQENDPDYFQAELYLKMKSVHAQKMAEDTLRKILNHDYPAAKFAFRPPTNIFEQIFSNNEPPLLVKVSVSGIENLNPDSVLVLANSVDRIMKTGIVNLIPLKQQLSVTIDQEKLLLYNVNYNSVLHAIKSAFNENQILSLQSYQRFLPVKIGDNTGMTIESMMCKSIENAHGEELPLSTFLTIKRTYDTKTIQAGQQGEYIPLSYHVDYSEAKQAENKIRSLIKDKSYPDVYFDGSLKSNNKMYAELGLILLVSILLLYFILAAQFESLLQPLIVLLEIPANIAGAFFMLWLFGNSLNIMSGIGMIVGCGVFINDSIIKVDTINMLRKNGMPLMKSIMEGGRLRIGGILMTAAITIAAVVPFLFGNDLGSVLQKPLSLALIGGMIVGTFVSLFFVPLVYWWIYRKSELNETAPILTFENEII